MNLFHMDSNNLNGPFPTPNICKKSCRGGAGAPPSACKRKAEDCPPLMGSSPLIGLVTICQIYGDQLTR